MGGGFGEYREMQQHAIYIELMLSEQGITKMKVDQKEEAQLTWGLSLAFLDFIDSMTFNQLKILYVQVQISFSLSVTP